jgi:hypothetical protein
MNNQITYSRELITPAIAKQILESNLINRRPKPPVVLRYASDMQRGLWKTDTAEFIKISKNGVLLDGQHRLMAVIKANTSVYFNVARGVNDEIFDVIDTGSIRNAGDVFKIAGVKRECTLPSIISTYNKLKNNKTFNVNKNLRLNNSELLQQYYEDELFWQEVGRKSHNWYMSFAKILQPSFIGGFYAYFYEINPKLAESFFDELTTGINVSNNIIHLLRNKLMQDKISLRKMHLNLKFAYIIKTWNYYVTGKQAVILKFNPDKEPFPTVIKTN